MKPETIMRLDDIWSDTSREHKDTDKVKQCRGCKAYFSPGTSSQQLLTHLQKCHVDKGITDTDYPGALSMETHHPLPPHAADQRVAYTRGPCEDAEIRPLLQAVTSPDPSVIRARLRELANKEQQLSARLAQSMVYVSNSAFTGHLNSLDHVVEAIAILTEKLARTNR